MKFWNVHLISLSAEAIKFFKSEITDFTAPGYSEVYAFTNVTNDFVKKTTSDFVDEPTCMITRSAPYYHLYINPEESKKHPLHLIARVEFKESVGWWEFPEIRSQVLNGTYDGVLLVKELDLKGVLSELPAVGEAREKSW